MRNFFVPRDKWVEIYNSVVLLLFFSDEYKNKPASIQKINQRYNTFCSDYNIIGKDFHFEGGANILSFCYLIIVRIIEIIDKASKSDGNAKKQFFKWTLETAKQDGITSFDDIVRKYNIDLQIFSYDMKPDEEKFYQLFRHLRHSVSHFSYEIDSLNNANFKSMDPKTKQMNLDMSMPMYQVINLTVQFGCWVNNTLHRKCLLS
jgi:hypothetical protein